MAGEIFSLPNETIEIRFISKQRGNITDTRHPLYGGMLKSAHKTYRPQKLENGNYKNVLTNAEKECLEKILDLPENGLSVYKREDNYWDRVKVIVPKEGISMYLGDPEQYIKFKVLTGYVDEIAPSIDKVDDKRTYKFVIVRKDDEAKSSLKKFDLTREAYKLLGKIEDNREAMMDFLRVDGIKVAEDTTREWMAAEISKMVVDNPKKFVEILKDPSYPTKVLLFKAIHAGEVYKKGGFYVSKDGEPLAEQGQQATLGNVIEFLESNINQGYRLMLMSKVNKD
jgi:hypothetical protein